MSTQRQLQLLGLIIREYIKSAKPVGSALVAKKCGFQVSPATIRNEMYELERSGYLEQLHTSGGRVPTDRAYRYFVDNLISQEDLRPEASSRNKIKAALKNVSQDPYEINKTIARVISELSDNLVITNIVEDDNFFKIGLTSLFEMPEFREFEKAFRLTSFFEEFENTFNKMANDFFGEMNDELFTDLQMFIGKENPIKDARDETIILTKYDLPGNYTGSLTLIGPIRMDYEKNISLVRLVKDELNKFSNHHVKRT